MTIGADGRCRRSRLTMLVAVLTVLVSMTGCGLLDGSGGGTQSDRSGGSGSLEKSTINVTALNAIDAAPFHLAREKGYFEDEGLSVKFSPVKSGNDSINKLVSGDVDIAFASYTPFLAAEVKGLLKNKGGVKIVADASSASANSSVVVATPSSPVKDVKDLAGKKIAVTAPGTMTQLMVLSTMKTNDVSAKNVKWVSIPFPGLAQALKAGNVDAAFATEPFVQDTMKRAGARPIIDTATGPLADIPLTGWATSGNFSKENPKTVAAFQRAMQRATDLATSDRAEVDEVLVKYHKVDKGTAKLATLPTYQSKLDATRIQRVADLMLEFDQLDKRLEVEKMIVPTAPLD